MDYAQTNIKNQAENSYEQKKVVDYKKAYLSLLLLAELHK